MIEGLKPYPEYKECDIPWASVLPMSWQTERAKRLFTKMQRPVRLDDDVVTCFRDGMVTLRKNRRLRGFTEATAFSGYQGIRKGDLVIHGMDAFAGAIGVSDSDGKGTPVYNVCKPGPGVVASYYAHTVREMSRSQWILALAKGIRERSTDFRYEMFGNQMVPLPPPAEQAAIVRFLDHANRKIDGFIRAKRKLIGLLNEQKQAIIHRAVTCGLNPDVPLKPSGIPWLGEIPGHWEVMRVKQCARKISKGTTPSTEDRAILESGPVRFLKAENISAGRITDKPLCFIDEETNHIIRRSQLAENDILFVIAGATLGKTAVVSVEVIPANTNQAVAFIRPNSRLIPCFLELWLQSPLIKELIWLNAVQSAQPNLSMADLGNFVTPVPTRNEQQQILDFVKDATNPMADAISRTEREIALMHEYRTRLTADLVTGKLDVREAAAKLPDPPAEAVVEHLTDDSLEESESEDADT